MTRPAKHQVVFFFFYCAPFCLAGPSILMQINVLFEWDLVATQPAGPRLYGPSSTIGSDLPPLFYLYTEKKNKKEGNDRKFYIIGINKRFLLCVSPPRLLFLKDVIINITRRVYVTQLGLYTD